MDQNAAKRPWLAGASQGVLFAAGAGTSPTVADTVPVVRPIALATRGRVEFTGRCPCGSWHRHIHLGLVTGPCGSIYRLEPRRGQLRGVA